MTKIYNKMLAFLKKKIEHLGREILREELPSGVSRTNSRRKLFLVKKTLKRGRRKKCQEK